MEYYYIILNISIILNIKLIHLVSKSILYTHNFIMYFLNIQFVIQIKQCKEQEQTDNVKYIFNN